MFTVKGGGLAKVCEVNAVVARKYDHERMFETLRTLLPTKEQIEDPQWTFDSLAVTSLLIEYWVPDATSVCRGELEWARSCSTEHWQTII